jgi:tetrahydromethanopterin S-methyltransferase subunit E
VFADAQWKQLAVGWTAAGLLTMCWTVYAVVSTWRASRKFANPVFKDTAFITLLGIIATVSALIVWALYVVVSQTM